jgi:hypothetical protein
MGDVLHSCPPRLLYIGDVPIQATTAGCTLMHRLLIDYPKDRLRIWESNANPHVPDVRLPGVKYESFFTVFPRLLYTRWEQLVRWRMVVAARSVGRRLTRRVRRGAARDGWMPEAILTVAHGTAWLSAAEVARRFKLPLHLIVQDEAAETTRVAKSKLGEVERLFGETWRLAASRMCASPFMAESYKTRYGAPGEWLNYGRAPGTLQFDKPPARLAEPVQSLTFAYAGLISSDAYGGLVGELATVLERRGHKLILFTKILPDSAQRYGLDRPNVAVRPFVPLNDLIRFLHENADVLYVPMSFDAVDRPNMEISFPTKLADYTAAGLPILIYGPSYCSAVRWAKSVTNTPAEVVDDSGGEALDAAVGRLENAEHRQALALGAIAAGGTYFTQARSLEVLYGNLCAGR